MGTGERLGEYAGVLQTLSRDALGRLPAEPRLDAKRTLARHAYEDARSVSEIFERLRDLPGTYATEDAAPLDKAQLVERLRAHIDTIDPLADEPTLELLTVIHGRQARHLDERPPPADPGDEPAHETWIAGPLAAELLAGEILARAAYDHAELPWEQRAALARATYDRLRHTLVLDANGTTPQGVYERARSAGLGERLDLALELARTAADAHPPLRDDLPALERLVGAARALP